MAENKDKIVFTLGCRSASNALKENGLAEKSFPNIKALFNYTNISDPHSIVIRSTAIELLPIEHVVKKLKSQWPLADILVWAPRCSAELVLNVLKAGAKDVVLDESPTELAETCLTIIKHHISVPHTPKQNLDSSTVEMKFGKLESRSPKVWDTFALCRQVAATDATVLLQGETGTGKELMARAIHKESQKNGRFVAINCSGIPEGLIDSELFGHLKGSFTGATQDKKGLFNWASQGTLFLDEIATMPLASQHHLLRVLQEGTYRIVGDHRETIADARIIAAASQDLEKLASQNLFREDLFYRLDVFRITIPPLRERPEDIVFLFNTFLTNFSKKYKLHKPDYTNRFIDCLLDYNWPGNVRQLENFCERVLLTHSGQSLQTNHFKKILQIKDAKVVAPIQHTFHETRKDLVEVRFDGSFQEVVDPKIEQLQRQYFEYHLKINKGRIDKTALTTGLNRRTLLRKLELLKIDKRKFK